MSVKNISVASMAALSVSLFTIQANAAPIVATDVLQEVRTTIGASQINHTSVGATAAAADQGAERDYVNGRAISRTNGAVYIRASINTRGGCVECEEEGPARMQTNNVRLIDDSVDHAAMEVNSLAYWSMSVANETAVDMNYLLDFYIPNSSTSLDGILPAGTALSAEVHAEITLDDVVIWSFGYKVLTDGTIVSSSEFSGVGTGPTVACTTGNTYCNTRLFNGELNLGQIGAGSSAVLEYNAWANVQSAAHTTMDSDCIAQYEGCYMRVGAQFGDPGNLTRNAPTLTRTPTNPNSVPEPGLLGLFGLGLAGLLVARRRRS